MLLRGLRNIRRRIPGPFCQRSRPRHKAGQSGHEEEKHTYAKFHGRLSPYIVVLSCQKKYSVKTRTHFSGSKHRAAVAPAPRVCLTSQANETPPLPDPPVANGEPATVVNTPAVVSILKALTSLLPSL